jgi:diguanylate cyclase
LHELDIPADPINYAVFYAYEADDHRDLNNAVDEILDKGVAPTEQQLRDLYRRFLSFEEGGEDGEVNATSERIQSVVDQVVAFFGEARADATKYGSTLGGVSKELAGESDAAAVADLVGSLIDETNQMVRRSETMEKRIADSAGEIETLREHLTEVRKEAMTDALTGIDNRKSFNARLHGATLGAVDGEGAVCLLLADIDHFKKFNDTYGHQVGDKVLRTVARAIKNQVKGRDTAARYGGEEFGVILTNTDLKSALTVAEQIRVTLASQKMIDRKAGHDYGNVTVSIGVSQYRQNEPLTDLVQRADDALYRAKENGRNRIEPETVEDDASLVA